MDYAIMDNDTCINVIVSDDAFAQHYASECGYVAVLLPDGFGIGDYIEDGEWVKYEDPDPAPEPEPAPDPLAALQQQVAAQASIAALSVGAEISLTPEMLNLATEGAPIAELGNAEPWRPGVRVEAESTVTYDGKTYECIQGHVTLDNWRPTQTPALWRVKQADPGPGETLPWVAGEAVKTGDKRTYGGKSYECIQGHTTQAGWEPPGVPALWKETA